MSVMSGMNGSVGVNKTTSYTCVYSLQARTSTSRTLEACISPYSQVHQALEEITTPLRWEVWDQKLATHPDQRFRRYIAEGIRRGFRVAIHAH